MAAPVTEAAITKIRDLINSGQIGPGDRLPPEYELAGQLGLSRNTIREAVRALVTARVLDVKRGDGTYVTSLEPHLLLEGIGFAVELMREGNALDVLEVRRILEPAATALAASRIDRAGLEDLALCLQQMRDSGGDEEQLVHYDAEFHARVASASGNQTLASILNGLSSLTVRARVWRGMVEGGAPELTIAQHAEIYAALDSRDPTLAQAAALVHVASTEAWLRRLLSTPQVEPVAATGAGKGPRRRRAAAS
jgi:GntR family transcriptional regulator, transcriptional repressor for pyruvate dehydrogenase complex